MSAAPLDLRTPQMQCPDCRAVVRIPKSGKVPQHLRPKSHGGYVHGTERCPQSFQLAPVGFHATWLRSMIDERTRHAATARAEAADARVKMEGMLARARALDESAVAIGAILASVEGGAK